MSSNKKDKESNSTTEVKSSPAMSRKQREWEDKLNANKSGIQDNAEDFTKQFMQDMYSESSMTNIETRREVMQKEEQQVIMGKVKYISF